MNRYLFKAKRKDGEWVYGSLIIERSSSICLQEYGIPFIENYYIYAIENNHYTKIGVKKETICQCTGLQDKDGKDIFENDIIDINQTVNGCNLFKIVWDKYKWNAEYYVKMATPILYEYNFEELLDINDFEKDIKIIGNKFDKEK